MEQASYIQMDTVTCRSHRLELKQSRQNFLHANRHRYTWFVLFWSSNEVQPGNCMRKDTVTRSSNCLELKQNSSRSLHANGHRSAWFPHFGVETKWNKLVACKGTPLRVVPTGWSSKNLEQACCMRMNTVLPGSHCLEMK